jgi:hypothetical protein
VYAECPIKDKRKGDSTPDGSSHQTGSGLGTSIKYLWRATSGAAGNDLGVTIKYLRGTRSGAAISGLSTMAKYLRGAAGIGLGTKITYLRCTAAPWATAWAQRSSLV